MNQTPRTSNALGRFWGMMLFLCLPAWSANPPGDLLLTRFSGPELAPCPACLCASARGHVYVGVDTQGSLGKNPGGGRIIRLTDTDFDGVADAHTLYATLDNPRGVISIGDKLYVLHTSFGPDGKATGMDLVVLEDANRDGVADGPAKMLIQGLSSVYGVSSRGTDHSTNGIRLGIDGWIYIAVGDFGFYNATDRDGTQLTLLGGGIMRVRPDGTEMEMYTTGLRNIYDMAIDPLLNIFTRGNTNDGGGWNIRFIHHMQSGDYGYPRLFIHFADEIIPALADLGGGSGTGAYYLSEPGWPPHYNNQPVMSDWGKSALFLHPVTPDGPTFRQEQKSFVEFAQPTDLDVDPLGQMFVSAWDGAGFKGNIGKGYVSRVVPTNWTAQALIDFDAMDDAALFTSLTSDSATMRIYAQQEILERGANPALKARIAAFAKQSSAPLERRVAALFTLAQLETSPAELLTFAEDPALREFALRAATDRLPRLAQANLPLKPFVSALASGSPRQQAAAAVALGRLGNIDAAKALLAVAFTRPTPSPDNQIPQHATPNASIVVPHLAVKALRRLNAVQACLDAIGTDHEALALWAISEMHTDSAVDGLIAKLGSADTRERRQGILTSLARLHFLEAPYDGSWWWNTRPDTRGPYYKPITWAASPRIAERLIAEVDTTDSDQSAFLKELNRKYRLNLEPLGLPDKTEPKPQQKKEANVDLAKIASVEGEVGKAALEDALIAVATLKGDTARGELLFTQQGCVACHSRSPEQTALGPYMGQIGSIMSKEQIAISILRPNDSISQGFQTTHVTLLDGTETVGFVTSRQDDMLALRDMLGKESRVAIANIKSEAHLPMSMMPEGLAHALSMQDFASLIEYLAKQK